MKINEFAFYRKRIRQTQEKIAEVLNIPLDIYIEIEDNKRKVKELNESIKKERKEIGKIGKYIREKNMKLK